jgi:hypothetical protein
LRVADGDFGTEPIEPAAALFQQSKRLPNDPLAVFDVEG